MKPSPLVPLLAGMVAYSATVSTQPARRMLDSAERAAVLALIGAVDAAQANDSAASGFEWDHHVLKSVNATAFVPIRISPPDPLRSSKSTVMYVRAVTRQDGIRSQEERSFVRDWLLNVATAPPTKDETVFLPTGEFPVGGPATSSTNARTQAAAEASARLSMQMREVEKRREANAAKRTVETKEERDPFRFPFEEYYSLGAGSFERAIGLPAGEYDVYVALVDRARMKTARPVVAHHTVTIPDFWNDQLTLSSLILASDVRTLSSPLPRQEQIAHPYTFGQAQVVPVATPEFSRRDTLNVVFQICNYGAPDTDLTANYVFYSVDGERKLFNRTQPQLLDDSTLPKQTNVWDTQAFTMQSVPLQPFPPGAYELEVTVRDNLTRASAAATTRFVVKP